MDKRLIWTGAALDPSGYGEATRGYLLGLARHPDIQTKLIAKNFWHGDSPDLRKEWPVLNALSRNNFDRRLPHVFVQHLTPENYLLGAGTCRYHVGMTTFETTSIPATWQMNMRAMDEIFTFSKWSKDVMESVGIRRPITVIPHGVDILRFNPGIEPLPCLTRATDVGEHGPVGEATYVFGSNFDWTERKNPLALLTAYYSAFKPADDVVLALKVYYQYPISQSREYIRGYIAEAKKILGLTKTPRVMLVEGIMPAEDLPRFYSALDCYVLPSRGEGWGLTYTEAMATGLPTVAVNWGGHTEFMTKQNSLLCDDYKFETITREDAGAQTQYVGHQWASVNPEELAGKMRWAFDNRDQAKAIGTAARQTMVKQFTWANAARTLKGRLDEIFAGV